MTIVIKDNNNKVIGEFKEMEYDQSDLYNPYSWLHFYDGWLVKDYPCKPLDYLTIYKNNKKLDDDYASLYTIEELVVKEETEDKLIVEHLQIELPGT